MTLKALPLAHNKDARRQRGHICSYTQWGALSILRSNANGLTVTKRRCKQQGGYSLRLFADYLVKGVPFRTAHEVVVECSGRLHQQPLEDLPSVL